MTTRSLDADILDSISNTKNFTGGTGVLPPTVSTRQKILKRFFRHKLTLWSCNTPLCIFLFFSLNFFLLMENLQLKNQSHMLLLLRIHFIHKGSFIGPFIYNYKEEFNSQELTNKKVYDKETPYKVHFFHRGEPYKLFGLIPSDIHLFGVDAPARLYLWGGDLQGRDIFSRILFGGRVSLTIGIIAIMISYPIGLLMGGVAGYFGGWIDTLIIR